MLFARIALAVGSVALGAFILNDAAYKRGFADAQQQRAAKDKKKAEFMARMGSCRWAEVMAKDYCSRPLPHVGE